MSQKKIQKPKPQDHRFEDRYLPDGSQKLADWLVKHTEIELKRLRPTVDLLLNLEHQMATNEVWKLAGKQKFEDFKDFCKRRFGVNSDVFFRLLRELKRNFPYDPLED